MAASPPLGSSVSTSMPLTAATCVWPMFDVSSKPYPITAAASPPLGSSVSTSTPLTAATCVPPMFDVSSKP